MEKVLIVSDSHGEIMANSLRDDYKYKEEYKLEKLGTQDSLVGFTTNHDVELDILILAGRTGFNFSNHLDLIKKDYSNHHIIFFLGYNDLPMLYGRNIENTVNKYISQACVKFDKSKKTVITPLKNRQLIEQDPINSQYYDKYVFYMKKVCQELDIKCLDIYEIIGNVTDQDYSDEHHLNAQRYFPIIDYALSL